MSGPPTVPGPGSRFTAQNQTTNERLSTTVVGLVALDDFRKRRAEVLEQQEREVREALDAVRTGAAGSDAAGAAAASGASGSEDKEGAAGDDGPKLKKKRKSKKVTKLSFMEEGGEEEETAEKKEKKEKTEMKLSDKSEKDTTGRAPSAAPPLKSFTKAALRRQAAEREALRKEFLQRQAAVKSSDIVIPFVFYEGTDIPGGVVHVKKGDHVWLFLDRSRKVGARLGVGDKKPSKALLHWARVGVDDLMLVRGNLILPHHYDFYFFIINKTVGPGGVRVFDYSAEPPKAKDSAEKSAQPAQPALSTPAAGDEDYSMIEGANDDPSLTKVVDRRWYERNKHIYPANVWQEFDPEQDYAQLVRRDQGGNAYFFVAK